MSQNMIVNCRRPAEEAGARDPASRDALGLIAGVVPGMSFAPQSKQNLACAGLDCPQAEQARGSAAPHSPQNLLPSGTFALQFGQCISRVPVLVF